MCVSGFFFFFFFFFFGSFCEPSLSHKLQRCGNFHVKNGKGNFKPGMKPRHPYLMIDWLRSIFY